MYQLTYSRYTMPETSNTVPMTEVIKNEINPRAISKTHDPQGRQEVAVAVKEARAEVRQVQEGISVNTAKNEIVSGSLDKVIATKGEKMRELKDRIDSLPAKLKRLVKITDRQVKRLQSQVATSEEESTALWTELHALSAEAELMRLQQAELPDPKKLIEAYYEKMKTEPLSNEEKREMLKPEVLAALSTEEYIALWRRLNPHFLTHVTRQGFRDHTGGDMMVDHHTGYQEFINGFVDVMGNGKRLFPPLARIGLSDRNEDTVKTFVSHFLDNTKSAEEAEESFKRFLTLHHATAPKYADITSTHLAAQIVSDRYYGGENGNEVFFVFPSDVLASQYAFAFNGFEKDFTKPQSETKWNDVFVWTDPKHPGLPVDSGIVFLPGDTPVDPDTGSKYASELKVIDGKEKRVMVGDAALADTFQRFVTNIGEQSIIKQVYDAYKDERNYYLQQEARRRCYEVFTQEIKSLGLPEDTSAILADRLLTSMHYNDTLSQEVANTMISGSGAEWKRVENGIPAKDYWENYFNQHPELRPKHVYYYDGDPTNAIYQFQQKEGIGKADTSEQDGALLGFDDHHITDMGNDPRSNQEYDTLLAQAHEIIQAHYQATPPQETPPTVTQKI